MSCYRDRQQRARAEQPGEQHCSTGQTAAPEGRCRLNVDIPRPRKSSLQHQSPGRDLCRPGIACCTGKDQHSVAAHRQTICNGVLDLVHRTTEFEGAAGDDDFGIGSHGQWILNPRRSDSMSDIRPGIVEDDPATGYHITGIGKCKGIAVHIDRIIDQRPAPLPCSAERQRIPIGW